MNLGGGVPTMAELHTPSQPESSRNNAVLLEQMRQHVSNLMAATHLLTPVVRGAGEAKYDQYLAIMNQSFYRLLRLMNHMEFARDLEGGELPFHPAALDLAGLCQETADMVSPLAGLAGVSFRYESELTGLLTTGDAALLRRLLLGLFSNAIRAAGEGGEAGLHLTKQKNRAILTVWDNGLGLKDMQDAPLYRPEGGMGLGLDIVRKLAGLHSGAVMLESRPERGVRAVVSLPIQPPEPGSLRTPASPRWNPDGGFSPVLVELSDLLPYNAFLPDDLE